LDSDENRNIIKRKAATPSTALIYPFQKDNIALFYPSEKDK